MQRAFGWIVTAYLAAGIVALAVGAAVPAESPLWVALWADLAATVVVFGFSFAFRNSSFYDAYWSVAPIAIALYWIAVSAPDVPAARQVLAAALVAAWGVRLTWNWARGWTGLDHEDWRYVDLQHKTGRLYWLVSFSGIHVAPTLWVFAGCLPLYPALVVGTRGLGALDALGVGVTAAAIALEARADQELRRFRTAPGRRSGDVLDTGLWSLSRHPNYLGEMGFWWGLWILGLAADPGWWWTGVGALSITLMFRFVSLPMIETRMEERRGEVFRAYQARTPLLLPRPARSG
jgi:steroid 5-alpha reductase family enzyme